MIKVGTVKSIWRYPVKGMAGESLGSAQVSERGVYGDRVLAVQDVARQEIQSCKFRPELLQCRAQFADPADINSEVNIDFPDGDSLLSDAEVLNSKLSGLLGHSSRIQALRPRSDESFYRRFKEDDHTWLDELKATFEREPGEPLPDLDNLPEEMQTYVSLLGSFFLVSPFHIITTASLDYLKSKNPDSDWHVERFRPNLVIETLPEFDGLVEQSWVGCSLKVGGVTVSCSGTAPRCGAVVREQQGVPKDSRVLRTIVREAEQNFGVYGDISATGSICVDDAVYLHRTIDD